MTTGHDILGTDAMNSTLLRLLMLGAGLFLGLQLMGCSTQDLSASPTGENGQQPAPVASFSQFSDIPVPAGASMDMERSLLLGAGEEWTGRLAYDTSTNSARVFDLYKAEMPKFGWTELTVIRGDRSVMTYQRGQRIATVEVKSRTVYGSFVTVTVSPNASTSSGGAGYGASSGAYGGGSSGAVSRQPLR